MSRSPTHSPTLRFSNTNIYDDDNDDLFFVLTATSRALDYITQVQFNNYQLQYLLTFLHRRNLMFHATCQFGQTFPILTR